MLKSYLLLFTLQSTGIVGSVKEP